VSFEPGTVIAGKYRVERVIGQGGMGVVLAARHLGLDEMVALKLIREERGEGSEVLARFQREARAAARIKSEHVARVLDVDRLPEGEPYIVMELIDGADLHALVKRRGRLPADEAVSYITQACEGLAEAHALGMVHRDLKLKNLFLTQRRDGRPLIKVIDFGVVKLTPLGEDNDPTLSGPRQTLETDIGQARTRDVTLTGASVLVGSLHYMAPEQIRASNVVTAQADVWSLGVCLYEMLTGALPFEGETVAEVCFAIQGRPVRDVRDFAPEIPPDLAEVVTRSLEKDVRRRFASVAEFATELAPHGLDPAAPARIETILQSAVRRLSAPPPVLAADSGGVSTVSMPREDGAHRGALGRAESTIDAAAVGSLAPYPAPPPATKRRWITGAVVMVVACGVTVAIWRPATSRSSTSTSNASASSAPTATPTQEPAPVVLAPSSVPMISGTSLPAIAESANAGTTSVATTKRAPRAKPVPAARPKAEPKTDPTSAYDHF
jgi:eukaryotic-like serine/threonine-protein kinase